MFDGSDKKTLYFCTILSVCVAFSLRKNHGGAMARITFLRRSVEVVDFHGFAHGGQRRGGFFACGQRAFF